MNTYNEHNEQALYDMVLFIRIRKTATGADVRTVLLETSVKSHQRGK